MIRALLPYTPLLLLLGSAGLIVLDRWLQRPGFAVEVLTVGSIGVITVFGLLGAVTGTPISEGTETLSAPLVWVGRAGTAMLYGGILFGVLRLPPEGPGRLVWSGLTTFCLLALFAQLVNPGPITPDLAFLPLTSYMLWRSAGTDLPDAVRVLKLGLWLLAATSAAVALTPVGWVETGGSFIGLDIRLVGVTSHPNFLGPYMGYLLLLNVIQPPERLRYLAWGLPALLLLLTQSKTAWAGVLVGAAVLWWFRVGVHLLSRHRWLPAALVVVGAASVALVAAQLPAQELLTPEEARSLTTLTGRSAIWGAGIEAFLDNPVFGAGSDVYADYAEATGQSWAAQAHNEFVQTIASEGLVGLAGLLAYLLVLLFMGLRLVPVSRGASLALVLAFVLRWMTETPARSLSFEHVIVVALLVAWSRMAPEVASLRQVRLRQLLMSVAPSAISGVPAPPADRGAAAGGEVAGPGPGGPPAQRVP